MRVVGWAHKLHHLCALALVAAAYVGIGSLVVDSIRYVFWVPAGERLICDADVAAITGSAWWYSCIHLVTCAHGSDMLPMDGSWPYGYLARASEATRVWGSLAALVVGTLGLVAATAWAVLGRDPCGVPSNALLVHLVVAHATIAMSRFWMLPPTLPKMPQWNRDYDADEGEEEEML